MVHHRVYAEAHVRTNIELDEKLVKEASRLTGIKTRRALIDEALRVLIHVRKRRSLLDLQGKIRFREDYDYKAHRTESA